jgi:hypothetical protein
MSIYSSAAFVLFKIPGLFQLIGRAHSCVDLDQFKNHEPNIPPDFY